MILDLIINLNFLNIKELSKLKCLNKYINSLIQIKELDLHNYYLERDIKFLKLQSKNTLIYYRYNTKYKSIFAIFENGYLRSIRDYPKSSRNFVNISIINYISEQKMIILKNHSKRYDKTFELKFNKFFINPWC